MRRALSRKAASLLLRRLLRALAASFDGAARLTQKMPTFGLILNCNFSSVSNGNERVCSRSGYLGMAARPSAGAPCHTRGKPPQHPTPPQTPPEGSGTAGFPAAALQVNARDHTNRVSRGGEEGFPPLRLLLHGSTPKQPGEQPSLQSGLRKAVGLAELLGQ